MHSHIMTTDLGTEKRCARCGEYWPADEEFFAVCKNNRSGLHSYCRACCTERKYELRHGAERKIKTYKREVKLMSIFSGITPIQKICCTSVDCGIDKIKVETDVQLLEACIKYEIMHNNRNGLLTALRRRIGRLVREGRACGGLNK